MNKHTKVCSNHFELGRPVDSHPNPTLFLKGYDHSDQVKSKRKAPLARSPEEPKVKKKRKTSDENNKVGNVKTNKYFLDTEQEVENNITDLSDNETINIAEQQPLKYKGNDEEDKERRCSNEVEGSQTNQEAKRSPQSTKKAYPAFNIDTIKHSNSLMKLYSGCPNYEIFSFIFNNLKVKPKVAKLQFHKGKVKKDDLKTTKNYQKSPSKPGSRGKPGPRSELEPENQLLMTLMKLRLDLHIEDLAFRFGVSAASVSRTVSTWIEFLGRELKPLIYWPTVEETLSYYLKCFLGNLKKVEGIIDCTEQHIAKPSNAKLQYQTYSQYKSTNTLKKLIVCTKSGSISYISDAYGGAASDCFITEDCGVVSKFNRGNW